MIYRLRGQIPSSCFTATTVIFLTGPIIFMLQYRGIPLFFVFVLFWYPMHCLHQRHALSASSSNFVFRRTNFGFRQTDRQTCRWSYCFGILCMVCINIMHCLHHRQMLFSNDQILVSDRRTDRQTDAINIFWASLAIKY